MARIGRTLGGISTLALVALASVVLAAGPALAQESGGSGSDSGSSSSDEVVANLVVTKETVEVRKAEADEFKKAKDGQKLREGDTVRTDATGRAEVEYGEDSYTRLDVNTTFTIVSLTDDQGNRAVEGTLDVGKTWNRTVAITESESFEQTGAGATAAVEGTAFSVECATATECVFTAVVDNVQLTGLDGLVKLLTPLDQCDSASGVLCGDITKIDPSQLPAWILENLLLDVLRGYPFPDFPVTLQIVVQDDGTVLARPPPPPPSPSVFSGAPGTGPDPLVLGPYNVTAFGDDTRTAGTTANQRSADVTTVTAPGGEVVQFSVPLHHREVGPNWTSWNSSYTGDIYCVSTSCGPSSSSPPNGFTITMPPNTVAFSFYAQSDYFGAFTFTAVASDGTSSGPVVVNNANPNPCSACAAYFGFYMPDPNTSLVSITISVTGTISIPNPGIAIGEFAIAYGTGTTSFDTGAVVAALESTPPPDPASGETPPESAPPATDPPP